MAIVPGDTLKSYFLIGHVPTPSNYVDLIDTLIAGGGEPPLHNHDTLYVKLDTDDVIIATHTFSPSVPTPPFILGANAQSQLVTGLYADKLDKQVIAGDGLTGGGYLTADRTLSVVAGDGLTVGANDVSLTRPGTLSIISVNDSAGNHTHEVTTSYNPGANEFILSTSTSGYLQLVRLGLGVAPEYLLHSQGITEQLRLAYDATHYASFIVNSSGNLSITPTLDFTIGAGGILYLQPTGDIVVDPTGNEILPAVNYDISIGSPEKKFLSLWAAELNVETLVARDVIATIGGQILVAPTTQLVLDMDSTDTLMVVKHNNLTLNNTARLESCMQVEFIRIDGIDLIGISVLYNYFIIAGDVGSLYPNGSLFYIAGTGTVNDTTWTVDHTLLAGSDTRLYTVEDIVNSTYAGGHLVWRAPSIAGPVTYPVVTRNLESDPGGPEDWYAGDTVVDTSWGFINLYSIHGVKEDTDYGPTIVGNVRNSLTFNDWIEHWAIGNLNGLYGYSNDTYGSALGKYSTTTSYLTAESTNGIRIMRGATVLAKWDIAGNILIGQAAASQNNVYISAGAISIRNNTTDRIEMTAAGVLTLNDTAGTAMVTLSSSGTILVGQQAASQNNVYISAGAISIRNNTTERIGITAAGVLTVKDTGGNAVLTFDSATGAVINKLLTMPGASSAISIGATPPTGSGSGTGIWIDRTGMYGLNTNVLQAKFEATSGAITAAAGGVVLNSNGVSIRADGTGTSDQYHIKFYDASWGSIVSEIYHYDGMAIKQLTIASTVDLSISGSTIWFLSTYPVTMDNDLLIEQGLYVGNSAGTPTAGRITVDRTDTGTNNAFCTYLTNHITSGTPTTGFGTYMLFRADGSAGANQNQGAIFAQWYDAGAATGSLSLRPYNGANTGKVVEVTHDGSALRLAFFGVAPYIRDAGWTITNRTSDRTMNCDATTVAELADVLGTLIQVLINFGLLNT